MKIVRLYCSIQGCNKSFRSEEQLASHLRLHSAEEELSEEQNTFECDICFAKYPTKRSVSAHKRIHRNEKNTLYPPPNINLFSRKFVLSQNYQEKTASDPYIVENIELPPITGPNPTTLPSFESLFKNN